ncbi:MAG: phosphorybosylanthranilate isomerase [Planctomycetota bacterium]|nr:MAG: phosphorybosylanthranilate isomerase [Planctomycetota bacterium]
MIIRTERALIGVIHLPPLPGSPRHHLPVQAIVDRSVQEARILESVGFDAVILENLGDAPFFSDRVPPATVACMTLVGEALRLSTRLAVGVNCLRNDAIAALGIAAACGASFIRVNVLTGVVAADQGLIQGRADEVLRHRKLLGLKTAILADVFVKHAVTLHATDLATAARDTARRGLADGLIVTGPATGVETSAEDVRRVRQAVPERPVFVGSGVTSQTVAGFLDLAAGVIVGSALKPGGDLDLPVDPDLAHAFVRAARAQR